MAEELKYRISFTKGSLAGQLFPLGDEAVILGRSHTCGIRVMEPDVSGRHVMLSVGPKGVEMEVISSRRTLLDGKALKTGDTVAVKAGQSVAMGGLVEFTVECYRNDGDRTEAPGELTDIVIRFGGDALDDDATRRPGVGGEPESTSLPTADADGGIDDTGDQMPPSKAEITTSSETAGTQRIPPPLPPPPSGGDTIGVTAIPPSDATQILRTRAATPQEMAYMRELHNKKRRRKLGLRLGLGGVVMALAAGLCIWLAMTPAEPFLSDPPDRDFLDLVDGDLRPVEDSADESIYFSYPASGGWGYVETRISTNTALGVVENISEVKTRVGRNLDVPLQLTFIAYTSVASLNQSQEEAFADWDRTNGLGLEKQTRLGVDFIGENPGIPCLRYTYTRKALADEAVEDWAGVLSFFRLRDACFVYFREVPGTEQLRAEHMLLSSDVFLDVTDGLIRTRWTGMTPGRQYRGELPILRNSVRELMDKNMDNEWEELEDKLTTILIRTYPKRGGDPDAARLYDEAMEWISILRARQTETWKKRCVTRYCVPEYKQSDEGKRQDEGIRALFRSPDDRRHYIAQKEEWWLQ